MKDFTDKRVNANLCNGIQIYTGHLWFYEDGFVYKIKAANADISYEKVLYEDILRVDPANTIGLIPNGLKITLKNSRVFQFAVNQRNQIRNYLLFQMDKKKNMMKES